MPSTNPIQLAIVSPCSTCKNQLSVAKDGYVPCPRRQIQKRKDALDEAGVGTQHLEHLALTGCEASPTGADGSSARGNNDLRNPVYWNEGHAILVWVATLADNGGLNGDGQATPHLLDPTFDTANIQCHPFPVVPAVTEAAYFTHGAFQEGDQVEVRFSANQQLDQAGVPGVVLVDGFAQRVNFAFSVPRAGLQKDTVPPGI